MTIKLYGIRNCDTVRRARAWLGDHGVAHDFHDFGRSGVPPARLDAWIAAHGWERLLNRRGRAWALLPEAERAAVVDAASARAVMLRHPSTIKRPVVEWSAARLSVGFEPDAWPLK